ncbi:MAG: DUF2752 domain-containing protein [Ferruginibacter sp.]
MNTFYILIKQAQQLFRQNFERLFWCMSLVLLFCMRPDNNAPTLCIFSRLNIHTCPGCGIGHAIRDALHLQLGSSFHHHPLGIVAVIIICHRIVQLSLKPKLILT